MEVKGLQPGEKLRKDNHRDALCVHYMCVCMCARVTVVIQRGQSKTTPQLAEQERLLQSYGNVGYEDRLLTIVCVCVRERERESA